jgi:hypothetical protein
VRLVVEQQSGASDMTRQPEEERDSFQKIYSTFNVQNRKRIRAENFVNAADVRSGFFK